MNQTVTVNQEVREFSDYIEMQKAHQDDVDAFPMVFMFGQKTDEEIKTELAKIGARNLSECISVMGCGDVMRKADVPAWERLCSRHDEERKKFSESEERLVEMIYNEMCNHEYGYTQEPEDTLRALGKTLRAFEDETFLRAWRKAEARCLACE